MICTNGHENSVGARFCGSCGVAMTGEMGPLGGGGSSMPAPVSATVTLESLKSGLMTDLQQQRHTGHPMTLGSTLAMVSGVLFVVAALVVTAYAIDSSDSDRPYVAGILWTLLGCVACYVVVKFISNKLVVAATTAYLPLSAITALLIFGSQVEDGKLGLPLIAAGAASAAAWFFPLLRGRPSLLAGSLLFTGFGLLSLLMQSSVARSADCAFSEDCFDDPTGLLTTTAEKSATLMLVLGIVLLAVAWVLDRRDWPQLGRTFIGVGIFFEVVGALGVAESTEDTTAAALLVVLAGALLIAVAVRKSRKTSLIIGGVSASIGLVAFVVSLTEDNETPVALALLLVAMSVGVGYLSLKKSDSIAATLEGRAS